MKFYKLFPMILAGLAFTACSDSETTSEGPAPDPIASLGDTGYLAFSLSLPTTSSNSTRSDEKYDDGKNDGTVEEYAVTSAKLVLFSGDTEADAVFAGAYTLTTPTFNKVGTATDQLTSEAIVAQAIKPALIKDGQLWAYVILNDNEKATVNSDNAKITLKGEDFPSTTLTKFSEFSQIKLDAADFNKTEGSKLTSFTMTNAPVADKRGGSVLPSGAKVTTLAKLDKTKIFATEELAKAAPAGHVDLERAAAKIEVVKSSALSDTEGTVEGTTIKYNFNDFKWGLNNTNSKYFNTRQWEQDWNEWTATGSPEGTVNTKTKYRFISDACIDNAYCPDNYRTFWAKDVNYAGETGAEALTKTNTTPDKALGNIVYTAENTFDVSHQTFENTTYLTIQVTLDNGETDKDFYTTKTIAPNQVLLSGDTDDKAKYLLAYAKAYLLTLAEYTEFTTAGGSISGYAIENGKTVTDESGTVQTTDGAAYIELTGTDGSGYTVAKLQKKLNDALDVKYYKGGVTYYSVRIKHFGAGAEVNTTTGAETGCETPWNKYQHTANTLEGIYGWGSSDADKLAARKNFLGRYGIVRNHWYKLEFGGIKKIGKSTPPTPDNTPDDPDDDVENYISLKLHILPWAIRGTQKFTL